MNGQNEFWGVFGCISSIWVLGILLYVFLRRREKWRIRGHGIGGQQVTWVYCPNCDNELTGRDSDLVYNGIDLVIYKCHQCNFISEWDFGPPAPVFLKFINPANLDKLIEHLNNPW